MRRVATLRIFVLFNYFAEPGRFFFSTFLPIVMSSLYPHTQVTMKATTIVTALEIKNAQKLLKLEKCDDLPQIFKDNFPEQDKQAGFYLRRLRLINGEPEVLDCDYLFNPPIDTLPREAAEHSIYEYFEKKLNLDISYATKTITVEKINHELQDILQLSNSTAVLVASRNFLNDTSLFQLTLSFHNPKKFRFVDFARRRKIKL